MDQAISFFRKIYEMHKSEAALILYWDKTTFKWSCPKQTVSGASVRYEEEHPGDGWIPILHMHSHASMSAFHSGVDDKDEVNVDGYNITIGKLQDDSHEFECRIMLGKAHQKCSMGDIIEDWVTQAEFPNEWLNRVDGGKVVTSFAGQQQSLFLPDRGSVAPIPSMNAYDGIFLNKDFGGIF